MKIALAQINPIVGDIAYNSKLIHNNIKHAVEAEADLVVFPEMAVIGYPPRDLLLKKDVVESCRCAAQQLAEQCQEIDAIIGAPWPSQTAHGLDIYNSALFCHNGQIVSEHYKSLLPSYDVFDEKRYFQPALTVETAVCNNRKLGITICEDLWNDERFFSRQLYPGNPVEQLSKTGTDILINCAASPFTFRKHEFRHKLMGHIARKKQTPLLYCNQVGGNDELVFDGNSCAFDSEGKLIGQAVDFKEDLLVVNMDIEKNPPAGKKTRNTFYAPKQGIEATYNALVLGLSDYCHKCGFSSIVLGLSGGIDSALAACIAVDALGKDNVTGITMPSRYSSKGSKADSEKLADNLGINFHEIAIEKPHNEFENLLAPFFAGKEADATEENLQARIRGNILMAFSNKFGSLLVTTGNKSEAAVGYCTLYGDMAGGLAVLSDVPKTLVYKISKWVNTAYASPLRQKLGGAVIPKNTIEKPPSAELREDQKDEDSLPDYEVLDKIIEMYVERLSSPQQIIDQTGFDTYEVKRITALIDRNEYKRKQMPPGIKVTSRAFGSGRRMPIAQRWGK